MPFRLRERLAEMSDAGVSFDELVNELEIYRGQDASAAIR